MRQGLLQRSASVFFSFVLALALFPVPAFAVQPESENDISFGSEPSLEEGSANEQASNLSVTEGSSTTQSGSQEFQGAISDVSDDEGGHGEQLASVAQSSDGAIDYVFMESKILAVGEFQNIAIALKDASVAIDRADLVFEKDDGTVMTVSAQAVADNTALFSTSFMQEGDYSLSAMEYSIADGETVYSIDFSLLADDGYRFSVVDDETKAVFDTADGSGISVLSLSQDGDVEVASSVEEGMEKAAQVSSDVQVAPLSASVRDAGLVVVIDPGHGGRDSGATGYGLLEKDLNLSIASYMRDELSQYAGVSVIMTRDGDYALGDTTSEDLAERVNIAKRAGADVLVSIHINSGGGTGSEVWVPNGASYNYENHTVGVELGGKIAQQLAALGLTLRGETDGVSGVKVRNSESGSTYPNGSLADYYSVIKNARLAGITGIIVEHAFIDRESDAAFLSNAANLKNLGIADARGVVQQFGLSKTKATLSTVVSGSVVEASCSFSGGIPSNVAYMMTAPNGTVKWYQAYRQDNGSWTASIDVDSEFAQFGRYYLQAWATVGDSTVPYATNQVGYNPSSSSLSYAADTLSFKAADWGVSPQNVAFKLIQPDGAAVWIQGTRNSDGSWIASRDITGGFGGSYQAETWCEVNGFSFLSSAAAVEVPQATVSLDASISSGVLSLATLGFAISPSNAAYAVKAPDGTTKWYPAYRQSDGTWTGSVDLGVDFGQFGGYTTQLWATFGSSTTVWASTTSTMEKADVTLDSSVTNGVLELTSSGFSLAPSNAAYAVKAPDGTTKWYPAYRQSDGTWTGSVDLGVDFGQFGGYTTQLWATFGSSTTVWASTTSTISKPSVSLNASATNGVLSLKTSAFGVSPSNACFAVRSPNGMLKWYQAYRQSDNTWVGSVNLDSEFGVIGQYYAEVWATFGSSTEAYASTSLTVETGVGYRIMAAPAANASQMATLFNNTAVFPSSVYGKYGASNAYEFCQIIYEEAVIEGVAPEVVFAQAMHETGWLRFGGQVSAEQCNFAGIGATNGGAAGANFNTYGSNSVRAGIRAQVQHLKAYASTDPLVQACLDPRFNLVARGCAPTLQGLDGRWTVPGIGYGNSIVSIIKQIG